MHGFRAAALLALALATPAAAAEDTAEVAHGRALIDQYQCGSCHRIPGVPAARGSVGPPLSGWRHRSYIAGRLPNRPDTLQRWIIQPHALVPDTPMPSMGVAPEHARAIAAYLYAVD